MTRILEPFAWIIVGGAAYAAAVVLIADHMLPRIVWAVAVLAALVGVLP